MPDQQIFFDPERKRWKRLRRFLDLAAVATTLVLVGFIFNVLRNQRLPELLLPLPRHNYRALPDQSILLRIRNQRLEHRKTKRKPSDIPLNTGEGLRAAYYVQDDTASYSSLKEHIHQIDMLFPQWLHVDSPNGTLMMMSGDNLRELPVIEGAAIHDPDYLNKVKHVIQAAKEDTEVFPAINNFNPHTQEWDTGVGDVLNDPSKSAAFREQLMRFLIAYPAYRGLSLDIESIPDEDEPAYLSFIQALYSEMHARNLRLWVNVAAGDSDSDFKSIAANSDGIVLMNYDEHQTTSDPGPVAAQPWFVANLVRVLKDVPKKKIICGLGNYGYDWTLSIPNPKDRHHRKPQVLNTDNLSVSDAWELASDADADLDLDYDTLNPHFEYIDEDKNQRHVVWFLDGVTLLNEMRAARQLGLETFALWRLGEEDSSLWNVWDHPSDPASLLLVTDEFPPTFADGVGLPALGAPKQAIVRRCLRLSREIRNQVHAVVLLAGGHRHLRECHRGGEDIERGNRRVVVDPRGQMAGPAHHERYADATFIQLALGPAQWFVLRGHLDGTAVVGQEEDQRSLGLSALGECTCHVADRVVEQTDLSQAIPAHGRLDSRETSCALGCRLVRTVRCIEGEIEQPGGF